MYYLQSRYYNPTLGRFLNADAFIATGQGILGNNMFTYCSNNPANRIDTSGMASKPIPVCFDSGYDEEEYEPSTKQANVELQVLETEGVSFYNGVPVIRMPFGGNSGFSAGIIFLGDGVKANESGIATLKHEYGHVIHLSQIGWESYLVWVLIPSVINYHQGVPYDTYYSQPWEYIADVLGGVERTNNGQPYIYSGDAQSKAKSYWDLTYEYAGVYPNN